MTDLRTAAQQALEALEFMADEWGFTQKANRPERWQAIDALRSVLEQPERAQAMRDAGYTRRPTLREMADSEQPEPWVKSYCGGKPNYTTPEPVSTWYGTDWPAHMQLMAQLAHLEPGTDLYTHPPRREWRGLTEEEINEATFHPDGCMNTHLEFARAIEAALKERNA